MAQAMMEAVEGRVLMSAGVPVVSQVNLVSDKAAIGGAQVDGDVVNAWGVAQSTAKGILWIGDNGTGKSSLFDAASGQTVPGSAVVIPGPNGSTDNGAVTGVATNTSKGFVVTEGGSSAPAVYLFVTEDGTISGWNPNVDAGRAINLVDHSDNVMGAGAGAVYKGVAIAGSGKKAEAFVANFRAGTVEAYNTGMAPVTLKAGAFSDRSIPAGFAPFNVTAVGNQLYVTYAKQDDAKHDDVAGAGNGFVDVYDTKGKLVRRLASGGALNSPWGVAVAPKTFGKFKGDILVGNFGDGRVNVFSTKGKSMGQLADAGGAPITIDGLWGLEVGDGTKAGQNRLYFGAGPNGESDGLFGYLVANGTVNPAKSGSGGGGSNSGGNSGGSGGYGGGFMY